MAKGLNTILIVDEAGFTHVCTSILTEEGFLPERLVRSAAPVPREAVAGVALLITSFPYGQAMLAKLKGLALPVIVLADHVGKELLDVLEELDNSYCMVKPIDYGKFTSLVKNLVQQKDALHQGGYSIV